MKKFRIENLIDACLDMGMNRKKIRMHLKSQGLKDEDISFGIINHLKSMQEKLRILS